MFPCLHSYNFYFQLAFHFYYYLGFESHFQIFLVFLLGHAIPLEFFVHDHLEIYSHEENLNHLNSNLLLKNDQLIMRKNSRVWRHTCIECLIRVCTWISLYWVLFFSLFIHRGILNAFLLWKITQLSNSFSSLSLALCFILFICYNLLISQNFYFLLSLLFWSHICTSFEFESIACKL